MCDIYERREAGAHVDLSLEDGEFVLGSSQLNIGLSQSLSLGLYVTVHLIELDNVDTPWAQTSSCNGLGADDVWLKRGVILKRSVQEEHTEWDRNTNSLDVMGSRDREAGVTYNQKTAIIIFR